MRIMRIFVYIFAYILCIMKKYIYIIPIGTCLSDSREIDGVRLSHSLYNEVNAQGVVDEYLCKLNIAHLKSEIQRYNSNIRISFIAGNIEFLLKEYYADLIRIVLPKNIKAYFKEKNFFYT